MNKICATPKATTPCKKYSGHMRQASPMAENMSATKILRLIFVLSAKPSCSMVNRHRERIGKHFTTVARNDAICSGMKSVKYSPIDEMNGTNFSS